MVGEESEQDYQDYQLELEAHTFPLLPYRIIWSNLNVSSVFFLDNLYATVLQREKNEHSKLAEKYHLGKQ